MSAPKCGAPPSGRRGSCGKCQAPPELRDGMQSVCLTRQAVQKYKKCIPVTTMQWNKCESKNMVSRCEKVPIADEKCLTVKTTKCRKVMKKVPIEKFMWEKVKKPVTRTIKRACIVPCTKTITVPSCRVEYRDEEVTEDKDEWVKKCYTDYECVSDYEEFDCEERIKVPTWRLEEKQTKVCETMTSWQGKEVKNPKYVECNRPCTKTYNATIPVKNLITTHKLECRCATSPNCYMSNHKMRCGACHGVRPSGMLRRSSDTSTSSNPTILPPGAINVSKTVTHLNAQTSTARRPSSSMPCALKVHPVSCPVTSHHPMPCVKPGPVKPCPTPTVQLCTKQPPMQCSTDNPAPPPFKRYGSKTSINISNSHLKPPLPGSCPNKKCRSNSISKNTSRRSSACKGSDNRGRSSSTPRRKRMSKSQARRKSDARRSRAESSRSVSRNRSSVWNPAQKYLSRHASATGSDFNINTSCKYEANNYC